MDSVRALFGSLVGSLAFSFRLLGPLAAALTVDHFLCKSGPRYWAVFWPLTQTSFWRLEGPVADPQDQSHESRFPTSTFQKSTPKTHFNFSKIHPQDPLQLFKNPLSSRTPFKKGFFAFVDLPQKQRIPS